MYYVVYIWNGAMRSLERDRLLSTGATCVTAETAYRASSLRAHIERITVAVRLCDAVANTTHDYSWPKHHRREFRWEN